MQVSTADNRIDPAVLLALVRDFLAQTRQQAADAQAVGLDSHFESDLGLDSLAKTELLLQIERTFQVSLPEAVMATETPRELLALLPMAQTVVQSSEPVRLTERAPSPNRTVTDTRGTEPVQAHTLIEMLDWHVQAHPEQHAIYLYEEGDQALTLSYAELLRDAEKVAAGLRARDLLPGQTVAIMLPTGRGYFASFFGILLAGATPVPIYPPMRPSQLEEHLRRHARILGNAQVQLLITVSQAKAVALLLRAQVPSLRHVLTVPELQEHGSSSDHRSRVRVRAQDLAFLQYTSGSTGDPKGVMLSHANLLANIRAMVKRLNVSNQDAFVSWLPLYHDMGLIGACLGSLYRGIPLAVMSPLRFLRRPATWLWAIHQHHGTLSAAPNFAYELCLRMVQDEDIQGLDLSSWRLAVNGAEPVSPATMRRFAARFEPYGFDPAALAPVYGLAECSVGLALPAAGRGLKVDRIQREALSRRGVALAVKSSSADPLEDGQDTLEIPACGHALSGHEIRIVDEANRELPERREGRLQFRGPSATQGYLNNPQANAKLFTGDWLESGDRAYLAAGDVYITGRVKDMIIRGGRNIYPYELEQAVGALDDVRKGCVAVFAAGDPVQATERIVIAAESRLRDAASIDALRQRIRDCSSAILEQPADDILILPPHTVLKTSSGKIRRSALRELYENKRLGQSALPVWLQVLRLSLAGLLAAGQQLLNRLGERLYGFYAWLIFALFAVPAALAAGLLPGRHTRWTLVHALARTAAFLTGLLPRREGLQQLPAGPHVAVCNHASYLDAILLVATLPRPYRFIAKRELANNRLLGFLLRRLGVILVERFNTRQSAQDSDQVIQVLQTGHSVLFFPEGTFTRAPGLLPFRSGAFVAAARADVPVVPMILRSSRNILRAGSWWPRREPLSLQITAPLQANSGEWGGIVQLRDQVRAVMLEHSGEPDLDWSDSPFVQQSLNSKQEDSGH